MLSSSVYYMFGHTNIPDDELLPLLYLNPIFALRVINRKTGLVILSDTCQLRAGDVLANRSAFPLGEVQTLVDHQNGWQWLTIKNLVVDGQYVIISLGYCLNALQRIELIVSKDRFDLTANWDSWSEQRELTVLAALRAWLRNELGREGKFVWGDARATYDSKGGYSSIGIHYR